MMPKVIMYFTLKFPQVNVEFEGFQASDGDFHGIKRLLQQNFRGLEVDLSGITDIIISQNYVGSVIKVSGKKSSLRFLTASIDTRDSH